MAAADRGEEEVSRVSKTSATTTKLYDRTEDEITLDEVERIAF